MLMMNDVKIKYILGGRVIEVHTHKAVNQNKLGSLMVDHIKESIIKYPCDNVSVAVETSVTNRSQISNAMSDKRATRRIIDNERGTDKRYATTRRQSAGTV